MSFHALMTATWTYTSMTSESSRLSMSMESTKHGNHATNTSAMSTKSQMTAPGSSTLSRLATSKSCSTVAILMHRCHTSRLRHTSRKLVGSNLETPSQWKTTMGRWSVGGPNTKDWHTTWLMVLVIWFQQTSHMLHSVSSVSFWRADGIEDIL